MILFALWLVPRCAIAEQPVEAILDRIDFSEVDQLLSEKSGMDLRDLAMRLAAGESLAGGGDWKAWAQEQWDDVRKKACRDAATLAAPSLLCGVLGALLGGKSRAVPALRLVCCAACAGILAETFADAREQAARLLNLSARSANVLAPMLISASALTGAGEAAAVFTPATSLCAAAIEGALADIGLRMCTALAALAAVSGFAERLRIDCLFDLGKRAVLWLSGGITAAFMGLMTLEGLLASGRGGTASRTAHFALESLIPVIGGEVSEAMETLLSSARLVKGAAGVTGMTALLLACAGPLSRIFVTALSARLAAVTAEMAGEERIGRVAGQFGEVLVLLAALSLAGILLVLLLAGGILSLAGNG